MTHIIKFSNGEERGNFKSHDEANNYLIFSGYRPQGHDVKTYENRILKQTAKIEEAGE